MRQIRSSSWDSRAIQFKNSTKKNDKSARQTADRIFQLLLYILRENFPPVTVIKWNAEGKNKEKRNKKKWRSKEGGQKKREKKEKRSFPFWTIMELWQGPHASWHNLSRAVTGSPENESIHRGACKEMQKRERASERVSQVAFCNVNYKESCLVLQLSRFEK